MFEWRKIVALRDGPGMGEQRRGVSRRVKREEEKEVLLVGSVCPLSSVPYRTPKGKFREWL